eukprot:2675294-Rhodomonas_salina.1
MLDYCSLDFDDVGPGTGSALVEKQGTTTLYLEPRKFRKHRRISKSESRTERIVWPTSASE